MKSCFFKIQGVEHRPILISPSLVQYCTKRGQLSNSGLSWVKIEQQFWLKVALLFGADNWETQLEKPAEESSLLDLLNTITLVSKQLAAW